MKPKENHFTEKLIEKQLITQEQYQQISDYRSLNLFSLNGELKFLLYLSVLLFTTGMGLLIYENIDTIGHVAILSLLLIVTITCFYFCFRYSSGFKKEQTSFENPIFDYLLIAANILSFIFIGYLQYQYNTFDTHYGLATLIPTVISFYSAYYFDNKSVLSIAITGLASYVGLTISPNAILNNEIFNDSNLRYTAIILGFVLFIWTFYASKINLKKHFNLIYLTFSLHLIAISCIVNLFEIFWYSYILLLAITVFYFYKASHSLSSTALFFFTLLYTYISINILLFKVIEAIYFEGIEDIITFLAPFYSIGSIVIFIKLIKDFNKKIAS